MSGFVIQKSKVGEWLDALGKSRSVLIPKYSAESDLVRFASRKTGEIPDWERLTTTSSPKGLFFPQSETLMSFEPAEEGIALKETLPSDGKRVLFGVRMCDARALLMLDKVFEDDPYYQIRRKNTALIAVNCKAPRDGCFCEMLGLAGVTWDLQLTDLGEAFYVEATSDEGRMLIEAAGGAMAKASDDLATAKEKSVSEFKGRFPAALDLEAIKDKVAEMWDDPIWVELSRRCIGCGTCTYLCPNCHCFDIQDETAGKSGVRYRCWDTCQERDFTHMGHGHNPRPSRKERHRQRVLHKFLYLPQNFGTVGCVACGRCVEKCPVNIDIREVLQYIASK